MNTRHFALAVLVSITAGCASTYSQPQLNPKVVEVRDYISRNKPLAESGTLKWSAYYSGLYERHLAAGTSPQLVQIINQMQWDAQQYENSSITKEEFEFRQRDKRAEINAVAQQLAGQEQARQQARTALALQVLQANQAYQPKPLTLTPIAPAGAQIAPASAPPLQLAATAYWTGKQTQVQTVTYQVGWNCEYNYAGRTFWRTFVGSCPSSVQVQ
jgi:hypothetical protein